MKRLLRPAIVIPAVAVLLFAGGILYAVTTGLDSGAVDENEQVLADAGVYPSSKEIGRNSETFAGEEAALPVPKGVVTTVAYAPPDGRLFLAQWENKSAGCVALRKLESGICEMKRLYLSPKFRGKGFGKILAEFIINEARKIGYQKMRLDTIQANMQEAIVLYRQLGFNEIAPYRVNPLPGVIFMELVL